EWIMKQWEKNYYISSIAGANNGSSLMVMSKVSDSFPFKWINNKWREGFHVTSMATAGTRWGIFMSRNAGFSDQLKAPKEVVVTDCVDREGTQGSGSGGWDGGGGVRKIFEKYHVGGGFVSTVNEAAMVV
ncbi:hypothetical protein Tco_1116722, partial [Tanacetum coccineum]